MKILDGKIASKKLIEEVKNKVQNTIKKSETPLSPPSMATPIVRTRSLMILLQLFSKLEPVSSLSILSLKTV